MVPTLFGILLISFVIVQFAPGGPVERVIAQLQGQSGDATDRVGGGRAAMPARSSAATPNSAYRGAQGLDPAFIKELEKQFGFDKPAHERFVQDALGLYPLRFRRAAISATRRCCS